MKSDFLEFVEEESAFNIIENSNGSLEDQPSENERQSSEEYPHRNTASISGTTRHNSQERLLVVDTIVNNFARHPSDHDLASTKTAHAKNETGIYRARRQDCG